MAAREGSEGRASVERPPSCSAWLDERWALDVLAVGATDAVVSACAAGDLAFALAAAGAGRVTHVALDAPAAALVALKQVAARELPVEGFRCFLGLDPAGRRVFFYHLLRGALAPDVRARWDRGEGTAGCASSFPGWTHPADT